MAAQNPVGVTWLCEDVRDMSTIESKSVDVAFDKGTLDAMIYGSPWDPPDEVKDNSSRYMKEARLFPLLLLHPLTMKSRLHALSKMTESSST